MGSNVEIVEIAITQIEAAYIARLFPNLSPEDFVQRALRKVLAEARLREFAAQKQVEIAAEEKRLNAELSV